MKYFSLIQDHSLKSSLRNIQTDKHFSFHFYSSGYLVDIPIVPVSFPHESIISQVIPCDKLYQNWDKIDHLLLLSSSIAKKESSMKCFDVSNPNPTFHWFSHV